MAGGRANSDAGTPTAPTLPTSGSADDGGGRGGAGRNKRSSAKDAETAAGKKKRKPKGRHKMVRPEVAGAHMPARPKRPLTVYNLFLGLEREFIRHEVAEGRDPKDDPLIKDALRQAGEARGGGGDDGDMTGVEASDVTVCGAPKNRDNAFGSKWCLDAGSSVAIHNGPDFGGRHHFSREEEQRVFESNGMIRKHIPLWAQSHKSFTRNPTRSLIDLGIEDLSEYRCMCDKCNVAVKIARIRGGGLVLYRKVDPTTGRPYEHNDLAHREFPGDKVEKQQRGTSNDMTLSVHLREEVLKRVGRMSVSKITHQLLNDENITCNDVQRSDPNKFQYTIQRWLCRSGTKSKYLCTKIDEDDDDDMAGSAEDDSAKLDEVVGKSNENDHTESEGRNEKSSEPNANVNSPQINPDDEYFDDPNIPPRYSHLKLDKFWYSSSRSRPRRKHRKMEGSCSFRELTRMVSARWKFMDETDPHVKMYCQRLYQTELKAYMGEMKIYQRELENLVNAAIHESEYAHAEAKRYWAAISDEKWKEEMQSKGPFSNSKQSCHSSLDTQHQQGLWV